MLICRKTTEEAMFTKNDKEIKPQKWAFFQGARQSCPYLAGENPVVDRLIRST
ncbi:MAG: hypothetical protein K9G65_06085 [Rickettsiaceae bacterium]|jgi:hypothetical protein|nr:hypothetical protein [Rickettsiaceae bacterium]